MAQRMMTVDVETRSEPMLWKTAHGVRKRVAAREARSESDVTSW